MTAPITASDLDSHVRQGLCPDEVAGWDSRDPDCAACAALDRVLVAAARVAELEGLLVRLVGTPALSTVQFYGNGKVQLILTPEGGDAFSDVWHLIRDELSDDTEASRG